MKTQNISAGTIRDALNIAGGLYSMNAKNSIGYAFTCSKNEVNCGEFVYASELDQITKDRFDGFISFHDKTLTDIESGEIIAIAN